MGGTWSAIGGCLLLFVSLQGPGGAQAAYMNFESVPTRPLALSPDGLRLFVTNTPDNRVEIFSVTSAGLVFESSVPVGLEPVAVAARTDSEVWVVNFLSDSVSIIDAGANPPRVVRTLHVGDEPSDVVFAGSRAEPTDPFPYAFVSAARRGQNHPENPKANLLTPSVGRADVWVFDAASLGAALGGTPLEIVQLFGDKPRPLATSPDGSTVFAGIFHSGNQTTTVLEATVCNGGHFAAPCEMGLTGSDDMPLMLPGGVPGPNVDSAGNPQPETSLIVKFDSPSGEWRDELGRDWANAVPFSLPDKDVFAIDATANPPVETDFYATVGTILYNMAVHPNGKVFVTNTDMNNAERFEGPGFNGSTSLRGHLAESRITVIEPSGSVVNARHLNKHINYGPGPVSFNSGGKDDSLATPLGIEFSADGNTIYVAGFGSNRIGVYPTAGIESGSFTPSASDDIALTGGGPAGMVRDDVNNRMYVYTRLDNAVKTVNLSSGGEIDSQPLFDAEPARVTGGRKFMYDAVLTSSNGEASCSSCHIFGNEDDLAWDLGNPAGVVEPNPNPFIPGLQVGGPEFHPMKGPMTTQTLRGLEFQGPMHWRGDRNDPGDSTDTVAAFEAFNPAFEGLLGRDEGEIAASDMNDYAEFALTIVPPPNPHRNLDNSLNGQESQGESDFINLPADAGVISCEFCHILNRSIGAFGGDGRSTLEGEEQEFKVPHLRNMYDKVGMFGTTAGLLQPNAMGDQIRGYGVHNDGGVATVLDFASATVFQLTQAERQAIAAFMLVFDANLAPAVGQQVTLVGAGDPATNARIDLLRTAAATSFTMVEVPGANQCDLIVKGMVDDEPRGWVMQPGGSYLDDAGDTISDLNLRALAVTEAPLTFTCTYPSGGDRIGVDRDEDGVADGEECGDVNGDGLLTTIDPVLVREQLAGLGTLPVAAKCNVIGSPGGSPSTCTIEDVVVATRAAAGLTPGIAQVCAPAL